MAKRPERPARPSDPDGYPAAGTFGELLTWHLEVWGTRPGCSLASASRPWTLAEFAMFIHGGSATQVTAERNLRNWRNDGIVPDPHDKDRIDQIFAELFGSDPNLLAWRVDLQKALEEGQALKRERQGQKKKLRLSATPSIADSAPDVTRVPRPTSHFVGRNEDVETLANVLSSDSSCAILLQGGPGIGKTELTKAIAHAERVVASFQERRFFVSLEAAKTAKDVRQSIIAAIGGDPNIDFKTALAVVGRPNLLVVLDNLETPWEPLDERANTEQVLRDLIEVEGVHLLASFRGYEAVDLPSLYEHAVEALPAASTIQLFMAIAGGWVANDPNFYDFIDALGGLPLATALVARRAHGCRSLAALWREWLKVGADLAVHPDFAAGRLTSLPHSIELSLRSTRMRPSSLHLFRILGGVPSGLTADDRDALISSEGFDAEDRLRRIGIVVDKVDRVDLLPPVREYARKYYALHRDEVEAWADYFLGLAQQIGETVGLRNAEGAMARLLPEFRNIEAAFRAKVQLEQCSNIQPALSGFYTLAALSYSQTRIFLELSEFFRKHNDHRGEAICLRRHASQLDADAHHDRRVLLNRAWIMSRQAQFTQGEADSLKDFGVDYFDDRTFAAAETKFAEAQELYERADHQEGRALCVEYRGRIHLENGEFTQASGKFEEAIGIYEAIGSLFGIACCTEWIAEIKLKNLDYEGALENLTKAYQTYANIKVPMYEAAAAMRIGHIAAVLKNYPSANTAFNSALETYREIRSVSGESTSLYYLADIALRTERYDDARLLYLRSASLFEKTKNLPLLADSARGLADIARRQGDSSQARVHYQHALAINRKIYRSAEAEYCADNLALLDEASIPGNR
jgi:tetratricopeptide (TPR) repeat protein